MVLEETHFHIVNQNIAVQHKARACFKFFCMDLRKYFFYFKDRCFLNIIAYISVLALFYTLNVSFLQTRCSLITKTMQSVPREGKSFVFLDDDDVILFLLIAGAQCLFLWQSILRHSWILFKYAACYYSVVVRLQVLLALCSFFIR